MEKSDLNLFLNQNISLELDSFVLSLIVASILSFIIQIFYLKFPTTLSNRLDFSKNFVVLGIATTIVITIVKSSLALSLGLVGALSIVRFRAAIKEPEELIYLFLIISVGLGCGAGQIKLISIGIIFSLLIIFFYYYFYKSKKYKVNEILNLSISKNSNVSENEINQIMALVKAKSISLDLISISKSKKDTVINFDIVVKNTKNITHLVSKLNQKDFKSIIARNDLGSI